MSDAELSLRCRIDQLCADKENMSCALVKAINMLQECRTATAIIKDGSKQKANGLRTRIENVLKDIGRMGLEIKLES